MFAGGFLYSDRTQLNSTDPVEQRSHALQTESTVVHAVELSSVELCRYKHPFTGTALFSIDKTTALSQRHRHRKQDSIPSFTLRRY